ncbi:hypothetical protein MKW94_016011, partial [Papaver nudicaule]|nr:hypothetical protein [Papaver nudicaule]
RVHIYPKGCSTTYSNLSLFLICDDLTKCPNVEFSCVVMSQTDSSYNVKKSVKHQFSHGSSKSYGWPSFMPLTQLHNRSKGYLRHDTCIIQVAVTCLTSEAATLSATGQMNKADPVVATGQRSKANAETSLVNELNAVVFIV